MTKLSPDAYLQQGYRDGAGRARAELTSLWAAAAATQLRVEGVTAEALDPLIARLCEAARDRSVPLLPIAEALRGPTAARALLTTCARHVRDEADRQPFISHLAAVLRVLALSEAATTSVPPGSAT